MSMFFPCVCVCVVLCFYVCLCMLFGPYNFACLFFFPIYKGGNAMVLLPQPLHHCLNCFELWLQMNTPTSYFVFFLGSHFSRVDLVFLCMPSRAFWIPKFAAFFSICKGGSTTTTITTTRFLIAPSTIVASTILVTTITTPIKLATPIVVATTPITITTLTTILLVAITFSIAIVETTIIITILVLQHQF